VDFFFGFKQLKVCDPHVGLPHSYLLVTNHGDEEMLPMSKLLSHNVKVYFLELHWST
jgi:hypothetical protein